MRDIEPAMQAGLEAGEVTFRDFLWFVPRNRSTGLDEPMGFWSGLGTLSAEVINPATGSPVTRVWNGGGNVISMGAVPLTMGLTVQTAEIHLSSVAAAVETLVRTHHVKRAPVQVFRGVLDPATRLLTAPAVPRFVGFVDDYSFDTPADGQPGGVMLEAVSHTQELTRSNAAKRSDADQRRRSATDGFYRHAAVVGTWKIFWGQEAE